MCTTEVSITGSDHVLEVLSILRCIPMPLGDSIQLAVLQGINTVHYVVI